MEFSADVHETQAFGPVAEWYDDLMSTVPYRMWVSYLLLLWAQQEVKPRTVLDVCCGTGTMAEKLAREGFIVEGFDLSEAMIAEARRKARKGTYHVANATDFELHHTYDAAYSFFDSLNYITTGQGLRQAIHRVAAHLKPGGSFIFDLNTKYAFDAELFDQENLRSNAKIRYRWTSEWDPQTLLIRVSMKFWRGEQERQEVHLQRAHPDEEVREYLAEAGFGQVRSFHSYTLDPPRETSDRLHYCAIRLG